MAQREHDNCIKDDVITFSLKYGDLNDLANMLASAVRRDKVMYGMAMANLIGNPNPDMLKAAEELAKVIKERTELFKYLTSRSQMYWVTVPQKRKDEEEKFHGSNEEATQEAGPEPATQPSRLD